MRQAFLREGEQNLGSRSHAREKSERKGYAPFTLVISLACNPRDIFWFSLVNVISCHVSYMYGPGSSRLQGQV